MHSMSVCVCTWVCIVLVCGMHGEYVGVHSMCTCVRDVNSL